MKTTDMRFRRADPSRPRRTDPFANNFNLLRLLAATLVIVSHAYNLGSATQPLDPLERLLGSNRSLGWAGVGIFFTMSGYLIEGSISRSASLASFAIGRFLRIFPGLVVCILLSTAILGLFVSTMPFSEFISNRQTIRFLLGNMTLLSVNYQLPSVFSQNPASSAVNGSLWTMPFEISCYIVLGIAWGVGLMKDRRRTAISLSALFVAIIGFTVVAPRLGDSASIARFGVMSRLAMCFLVGVACSAAKDVVRIRLYHVLGVVVAGLGAVVLDKTLIDLALSVVFGILTLWVAFVRHPFLKLVERMPDYSYGIYIYGFTVQQLILSQYPQLPTGIHVFVAFLLVLIPAGLSWHLIEKPALRLKPKRSLSTSAPNVNPLA